MFGPITLPFGAKILFNTDAVFTSKFAALAAMCSETKELGYDMLWQGMAKTQ